MLEKILNRIRTSYTRPLAFAGAMGLSALGALGSGACDFGIKQTCDETICVGDYQRDAGHGDAYDARRAGGADAVVRNGHDAGRNADATVPAEAGGAVFADAHDAGYDAARDVADSAVYHDARTDADAAVLIGDAGVPDVFQNPDSDDDGILNEMDNCPAAANAGQRDDDWNGVGRECDEVEREAPCLDGLVFSSTRLSPNADEIRFHLFRYHQLGENDHGLPPDTPTVLSMLGLQHDGVLHEPAVHPYGRFIAYTTVHAGFDRIFILNPGTRQSAELPIDVQDHHLANPLWAPDGASLFFLTGTAQRTDVYRAWRDGSVECVSCEAAIGSITPAFPYAVSPNTRYVAYPARSEGRNGLIDLVVFDRIDEELHFVSDGMEDDYFNVISVAWHPSDNVFVYAAENFPRGEGSRRDLFLCRFAPGEPCRIGQNAQQVTRNANLREFYEMAWSPDGSLAVESAPVGGERRITIYRSFLQQAADHPDGALVQEEVLHRPGHDTQPSFFPGCDDRQEE